MKKKIIIIGGGMGGLSAGIFALLSGFDVELYEKNHKLGGNCGSYYRDGYLIDHCIHWLIGTDRTSQQYQVWTKLHALNDNTKIISLPHLISIYYQGQYITLSRDYKASHKQWLELFPDDKDMINNFFSFVEDAVDINMVFKGKTLEETRKLRKEFIKHNVKHLKMVAKTSFILRSDYALKFKSPVLRRILENAQHGYGSLFSFLFEYACFINNNADIPEGGSDRLIKNMEEYFKELGGVIYTQSKVSKVVIKKKNIDHIELETGKRIAGDLYICAVSPYYFHGELTNGKYLGRSFKQVAKRDFGAHMPSCYHASFVIPNDLININIPTLIACMPFVVGDTIVSTLDLRVYNYEDIYIKDGQVVMNVLIDQKKQDYIAWSKLSKEEYEKEKERITNSIIMAILDVFPSLAGKIKHLESFTPLSLEKYTNTPYGAYMSFPLTKTNVFFVHSPKCHTLKNLYYSTQWIASPGGLPLVSATAEWCINKIKKDLDQK